MKTKSGSSVNSTILGTISGLALYSRLGTENNNGFKL